ncbi:MAG: hypothetical protein AAF664_17500 [Planctomycetota bacterium]
MTASRVFVFVQTVLVVVGLIASIRMHESRIAAADAQRIAQRSAGLAKDIQELREIESVADDSSVQDDITNVELVGIAQQSGIPKSKIQNIERLPVSQAAQSDYEEQVVVVQLSRVSLQKLVDFIVRTCDEQPSYVATSLSLVPGVPEATSSDSGGTARETSSRPNPERWNATLTLTQLVYAATRSKTAMRGP